MSKYEASGTFLMAKEAWDVFIEAFQPQPRYRVRNGELIELVGPCDVTVGDVVYRDMVTWVAIGKTRGPEGTDRLRKFVRRNGELVEVRTRGRTGHRTLEDAIRKAI